MSTRGVAEPWKRALGGGAPSHGHTKELLPDAAFRARAAAGAWLAAMRTALVRWAEDDGRTGLPGLIAQALVAAFGADVVDIGRSGEENPRRHGEGGGS